MWESKTGQFNGREMGRLERMTVDRLVKLLLTSHSPLSALRVLAEVMLNGADDKLAALLANEQLRAHWRRYEEYADENALDAEIASKLERRIRSGR